MADYKPTSGPGVIRIADRACIPSASGGFGVNGTNIALAGTVGRDTMVITSSSAPLFQVQRP